MSHRCSGCGIAGRSAWRPTGVRRRRREQRHNYHALRNRLNGLVPPSSVQSEAAVAPPAHEAAAANGPASEPALQPDAAANDNEPVVELSSTGTEWRLNPALGRSRNVQNS